MAGNLMDPTLPVDQLTRLEQLKFSTDAEGSVIVRVGAIGSYDATSNHSTTPLDAGQTFTGDWQSVKGFTDISVVAYSDKASATDGLQIQKSIDGINELPNSADLFTIPANQTKEFSIGVRVPYYRLVYVNGSQDQGTFMLHMMLHTSAPKPSSHRINDTVVTEDDAELVKSVLTAKRSDDGFTNIGATKLNNLKMSVEEFGGNVVDAFGRLRVSETTTLFDSAFTANPANGASYDFIWDTATVTTGGTATATWSPSYYTLTLNKTSAAEVSVTRQSIRSFKYYPGKSQLIEKTFQFHTPTANLIQEDGLSDGVNGLLFRANGTTLQFVLQKGGVEQTFDQSTWNIDKFDGNGPSEIILDPTKSQILVMDFQWLSVGRVRWGFIIDGVIYFAHTNAHANMFTGIYSNSMHLPLRSRIHANAALPNGTYSMLQICSTVQSEGGISEEGFPQSWAGTTGTGFVSKAIANGSFTPVCSLRGMDPYTTIRLSGHNLQASGNVDINWAWYLNPTLTGATFANQRGLAQVDTAATAFTGGIKVTGGYIKASNQSESSSVVADIFKVPNAQLGRLLNGTYTHLTLVAGGLTGGTNIFFSIDWREIV